MNTPVVVTYGEPVNIDEHLAVIGQLWLGEEGTGMGLFYEPSWNGREVPTVIVSLTLSTEFGNQHHADWVEYTWQFYGDGSALTAFAEARKWVEQLAQLKEPEE